MTSAANVAKPGRKGFLLGSEGRKASEPNKKLCDLFKEAMPVSLPPTAPRERFDSLWPTSNEAPSNCSASRGLPSTSEMYLAAPLAV